MNPLDFINKIGITTYKNLVDKNFLEEVSEFDEDDIDFKSVYLDDYGLILEFYKSSDILNSVEISNIESIRNILPEPFKKNMTRNDVIDILGNPIDSRPPRKILTIQTGGVDQFYWLEDKSISVLAYYHYDSLKLKTVSFLPSDQVSWGNS